MTSLLSVGSVLLAAYGFFYTHVADTLTTGLQADTNLHDSVTRARERKKIQNGLWRAAVPLAIAAASVALVLLPDALGVARSIDFGADYDAVNAALLALEGFWIALAAVMTKHVWSLAHGMRSLSSRSVTRLEESRPTTL